MHQKSNSTVSPKDWRLSEKEAKELKEDLIHYDTKVLCLSLRKAKKWADLTIKAIREVHESE